MDEEELDKAIERHLIECIKLSNHSDLVWTVGKYFQSDAETYDGSIYIRQNDEGTVELGVYIGPDGYDEAINFVKPLTEVLQIGLKEGTFAYDNLLAVVQALKPA